MAGHQCLTDPAGCLPSANADHRQARGGLDLRGIILVHALDLFRQKGPAPFELHPSPPVPLGEAAEVEALEETA